MWASCFAISNRIIMVRKTHRASVLIELIIWKETKWVG